MSADRCYYKGEKGTVLSISGDKKQALLQPIGDVTLRNQPECPVKVEMNYGKITGWILFDVEKGDIMQSTGLSSTEMTMSQGGQSFVMKSDTKVICQSRVEGQ